MDTILALLAGIVAALAPAGGAPAAPATERIPAGAAAATRVAVARPADDVAHPGSRTEWWYAHALDPATGRTIIVTLFADPVPAIGGFWFDGEGGKTHWTQLTAQRQHDGPGTTVAGGAIRYDAASRSWIVRHDANGYRVRLRLTRTVPGVTAGPVAYGDKEMHWTVPVATGRADGEIVLPDGERIEVRGWRAYHDHNWGRFDLQSRAYRGWEWAVVHEPGRRAALLGGLTGTDGRFRGVLVQATPGGTTSCRPSLVLRDFAVLDGHRFPRSVAATCPGRRPVRFTVTEPYVARLTTHALTESLGRTGTRGSLGLIEHLAALAVP